MHLHLPPCEGGRGRGAAARPRLGHPRRPGAGAVARLLYRRHLQRRLRRHPRQQRKASMTIPQKRHIVSNLKIKEISSVDNPAQVGATAVLIKRADGDLTEIRKNAAAVAAGEQPKFGVADYEDAMFACAAELAKDMQCTPEQALLKGLPTDPALSDIDRQSTRLNSSH